METGGVQDQLQDVTSAEHAVTVNTMISRQDTSLYPLTHTHTHTHTQTHALGNTHFVDVDDAHSVVAAKTSTALCERKREQPQSQCNLGHCCHRQLGTPLSQYYHYHRYHTSGNCHRCDIV